MKKQNLLPAWVDGHCHLADPRLQEQLGALLDRCKSHEVKNFLMAGIGPEDWENQKSLIQTHANEDFRFFPSYGLHPYWIAERSSAECEAGFQQLALVAGGAFALGEMGLDYRTAIVEKGAGGRALQREYFQRQITLAQQLKKVAILHLVRCHDEAIELLKPLASQLRPSMIHSFNAGEREASKYLDMGFTLSIGSSLLRDTKGALSAAVRFTPLECLLLESDSPDQAPPAWKLQYNEPWTILLVAERMAELKGLQKDDVLQATRQNFQRIFAQELL